MKAVNRAGWFNYMDQLHHLEVPATGNSAPLARVRTAGAWLERSTAPRLETSPSLDPPAVPPSPSARDGRVFILVRSVNIRVHGVAREWLRKSGSYMFILAQLSAWFGGERTNWPPSGWILCVNAVPFSLASGARLRPWQHWESQFLNFNLLDVALCL